ncbi:class I SAM-dependent methyltransferase [Aquihabitans daechungensis]|uniref:class I SAM-dependent methyltransferase n=1 Tax=Aquihabitans daechungensis TaxID=1052257 RepID=UPI003BA2C75E
MPSIDDNRALWGDPDRWDRDGDEWSAGWGGPASQWSSWIAPRLRSAAGEPPHERIVEIGCGHGRWTQFLADWTPEVVAVDVAPECVEACAARFAGLRAVRPVVGDGRSLPTVADRSVDLVFSFDSLVHADAEAIGGYVEAIARVLAEDGVAWIHHSNLRASRLDRSRVLRRIGPLHRMLVRAGIVEREVHWRDPTVDADLVAQLAVRHGLVCSSQELLPWSTRRTAIDCVSVLVRPGSRAPAATDPKGRWRNDGFESERAAAWEAAQR